MKRNLDLAFRFHQVFYDKTVNDFLNSEHKIIYAEKRVNNFLNNVEQKIILCKMLEIVYVENSEQVYLMQKLNSYFEIKISIFYNASI